MDSQKSEPDTPYGKNVRYTVRFHVVSMAVDRLGLAEPVDEYVERHVVTPFGEMKAVAIAAIVLDARNPELIYHEVEIASVEDEFKIEPNDLLDREAIAR